MPATNYTTHVTECSTFVGLMSTVYSHNDVSARAILPSLFQRAAQEDKSQGSPRTKQRAVWGIFVQV